jgi:hypothetical protein
LTVFSQFSINSQDRIEGEEPLIFTEAQNSKAAQKSEIYVIILLFWDQKTVEFLQILGPVLKFRDESGARKSQKKILFTAMSKSRPKSSYFWGTIAMNQ